MKTKTLKILIDAIEKTSENEVFDLLNNFVNNCSDLSNHQSNINNIICQHFGLTNDWIKTYRGEYKSYVLGMYFYFLNKCTKVNFNKLGKKHNVDSSNIYKHYLDKYKNYKFIGNVKMIDNIKNCEEKIINYLKIYNNG
jgi:hypothetical protein